MKFMTMIVVALASVLLVACGTPTPPPPPPTPTPKLDWQTFTSDEGGFSVLFPGQPAQATQVMTGSNGDSELITYNWQAGPTLYTVGYSDYSAADLKNLDPNDILDVALDGAVKNVKGKVLVKQEITLEQYPGRDVTIEFPDRPDYAGGGIVRLKLYLVNQRIYEVMTISVKADLLADAHKKFINSFTLLKK
jgi:hypothetical protein